MTLAAPHRTDAPTRLHTAAVAGLGSAQPELTMAQEEIWDAYFAEAYSGNRLARRIWERSGVERRYGCLLYTSDACRRLLTCRSRWSPYH